MQLVDRDTPRIIYKNQEQKIRLDGIDTPECRANGKAEADSRRTGKDLETIVKQGREANKFVMSLVKPGDEIVIEFVVKNRDRYGRLLGYVYLPDGRMLNEEIVKAGYASLMTVPPMSNMSRGC